MKKRICLTICAGLLLLSLVSCVIDLPYEFADNETTSAEIIAFFNSVEDLKIAIKKDPSRYNGQRVSVKAYASKLLSSVYIFDNLPADDELWDDRPRIQVFITDDLKLSVLEKGDYIDLNGIITISSGEISMTQCTYTMIRTNEEQN